MLRLLLKAHLQTLWRIALLFSVIGLGLWYYLCTELGIRWTIQLVNLVSPVHIQINDYEGSLSGSMHFEGLSIEAPDYQLSIENIDIQWSLSHLVLGIVEVDTLKVFNLNFHWHASEQPSFQTVQEPPSFAPSLQSIQKQIKETIPLRVKIRHFAAQDLEFNLEQPMTIDRISFAKFDSYKVAWLKTLSVEGNFGYLALHMNDHLHVRWDLSLPELSQWVEQAHGDLTTQGQIQIYDLDKVPYINQFNADVFSQRIQWQDHQLSALKLNLQGNQDDIHLKLMGDLDQNKIDLSADGHHVQDQWTIKIHPINWQHPHYGKLPKAFGEFTLTYDPLIQGQLNFTLFDGNQLNGTYQIDPKNKYQLNARLDGTFKNFSALSRFFPDLDTVTGLAKLQVHLAGHLQKPKIWGNVHFTDISAPLLDLGTHLYVDDLLLESEGQGLLNIQGRGKLGDGELTVQGEADFNQATPSMNLSLQGTRLLISKTPEYLVYADPDLHLTFKDGQPHIRGTIFVPEASIDIINENSYIKASSDVTVVQNKISLNESSNTETPSGFNLTSDVSVELGSDVYFKGYQLESRFTGKLDIQQKPNYPTMAQGKIILNDAKYRAKGKILNLTHAELSYSQSPLKNPALNIKAEREVTPKVSMNNKPLKVNNPPKVLAEHEAIPKVSLNNKPRNIFNPEWGDTKITVGITLKGTLSQPQLSFFSKPSMPQGDILSYLLLDKPQKDATLIEGKLLFEAADQMVHYFGRQNQDVRPSLAERFHLDTLEVQTENSADKSSMLSHAVLVVGKQFSSRLYAEYSHGIVDAASSVRLRYLVGRHITLETKATNQGASADVLFVFEKD